MCESVQISLHRQKEQTNIDWLPWPQSPGVTLGLSFSPGTGPGAPAVVRWPAGLAPSPDSRNVAAFAGSLPGAQAHVLIISTLIFTGGGGNRAEIGKTMVTWVPTPTTMGWRKTSFLTEDWGALPSRGSRCGTANLSKCRWFVEFSSLLTRRPPSAAAAQGVGRSRPSSWAGLILDNWLLENIAVGEVLPFNYHINWVYFVVKLLPFSFVFYLKKVFVLKKLNEGRPVLFEVIWKNPQ